MRGFPRIERSQWDGAAIAASVLLAFSFVLGGASRQHELRLALVELSALPLLVLAGSRLLNSGDWRRHTLALGVLAAAAAIPLLQILPIPAGLWTGLPGREQLVLALGLADIEPGWGPMSLTPGRTWRSFLALVPPAAMFMGALTVNGPWRVKLAYGLLIGAIVAIALGTAQLASGGTALYVWSTTDAGNVTGFFANRNHLATLCLVSLPFAAVFAGRSLRRGGRHAQLVLWLAMLFIAIVVVALGVIRSRAGVMLVGPSLAMSLAAAWVSAGRGWPKPAFLGLIGAATAAFLAVAIFALGPIMARFDSTGAREGRFEYWPIIADTANTYLPVGSGLGSFDAVFRSVEPLDQLDATYFNQAHNDYLELWLETGWLGAAALVLFLTWFVRRSFTAWTARASTQRDLQRAASVAILLTMLHSGADYPLRTETMAVLFAMFCGLLEWASVSDGELSEQRRPRRRVRS